MVRDAPARPRRWQYACGFTGWQEADVVIVIDYAMGMPVIGIDYSDKIIMGVAVLFSISVMFGKNRCQFGTVMGRYAGIG